MPGNFKSQYFLLLIVLCCCVLAGSRPQPVAAEAFKSRQGRHSEFVCPPALRPRVDFWIDIFTRYGKHEVVIHHRRYPQAIYDVVDMRREGAAMHPVEFDKFKERLVKARIREIEVIIRGFANGQQPRTAQERQVMQALQSVPGNGRSKYLTAVEEDMVRSQTGIKERYREAVKRTGRYMFQIEQVFVNQYGLPVELTRLPFIESSFDYTAYSSVGAAGIWQFMPRTAKSFGLQVNNAVDERRDVERATKAAALYLSRAYKSLGNWPLALTSYNNGVTGVKRKVNAYGTSDIVKLIEVEDPAFGFASGNFWPEFLAALDVYDSYQHYFPGLQIDQPRRAKPYTLPHAMSAAYVSRKVGVSTEELKDYNYALTPGVWKGRYSIPKGFALRVPLEMTGTVTALRAPEPEVETSTIYGGVDYTVRSGDTLLKIAKKFNVTVDSLRRLNGINGNSVKVGQKLKVKAPEGASGEVAPPIAPVNTVVAQPEKVTSPTKVENVELYIVKSGDTISSIAKNSGLTTQQLQKLNGLKTTKLKAGQKIKIKSVASSVAESPKVDQAAAPGNRRSYVVQNGDTLWAVSKRFSVSVDRIKKANRLNGNNLKKGQKLVIP